MILIKMAVGALLGAIYFFAISGWKKDQSPWFKARRIAGWLGLIAAELMILVIGYPRAHGSSQMSNLFVDITFGISSWLIVGVPCSLIIGLAAYIVMRVIKKSEQAIDQLHESS